MWLAYDTYAPDPSRHSPDIGATGPSVEHQRFWGTGPGFDPGLRHTITLELLPTSKTNAQSKSLLVIKGQTLDQLTDCILLLLPQTLQGM